MPNFRFFKTPFIFVALFFALGIFLVHKSDAFLVYSLMAFLVPISLYFFKKKGVVLSFAFASFLFLGGFLQYFLNSQESILSKYQYRQVTMIGTVDEIASDSKTWRKSLFSINQLIVGEKSFYPKNQVLLYISDADVRLGDQILVSTKLQEIENKGNPGEFDAKTYWNNKGIQFMGFVNKDAFNPVKYFEPSMFQQWRAKIVKGIEEGLKNATQNNPESYGVARALILGDKSELNPAVKESFQSAGAMHVLAVSGLHIGVLLTVLIGFFSQFSKWISRTQATLVALAIIWIYAFLIDFPPSVVRASLLFSIIFLGKLLGARQTNINTLAVAFVVMLMINPRWLFDVGFQLSFLAMVGIYTLYNPISNLFFIENKWIRKVWEGTAVGISAQLFTLPLTLYYFHQFPNYFILTNIGMMVFAFIVLLLGFAVLTFQWIPGVRIATGFLFAFSIGLMLQFVDGISSLPGAVATGFNLSVWTVLLMYFLLITFLIFRESKKYRTWIFAGFGLLFLFIQLGRFQQMNKEELVIFNADFPLISIKNGTEINIFHPDEKLDKAEKMLQGYAVLSGGKTNFIPLDFQKAQLSNGNYIERQDGGFVIKFNEQDYFLRTELMKGTPSDCFVLDFARNQMSDSNYSLENGAFIN